MDRLAVYTDLNGKIYTKTIKPRGNSHYLLTIPQGRVTLEKKFLLNSIKNTYSELWVEVGKQNIAYSDEIYRKAFDIFEQECNK